ncbi:methyltransferase domain-containing protein [Halosimplex rubrum]|uniref:Methyltransferase domain-containing protein n=1 Tax=Halosimplex rubrum TaxID=869889 RepID=A0A7D5SPH7_9EURY|nr:class I SAM-dependent methyltransferase [Halosimplex rubrum]QLH76707.1 methyltransferase domain-containing protein [Halosimplex rubrum]
MVEDRWREFYEAGDYERCAYLAGEEMDEYVDRFLDETGADPDSFASVGCGPAVTEFALAERHPDMEFYCCDISEDVIRDDHEVADRRDLSNISFRVRSLPDLDVGREFDIVYCMATLYFVEAIEDAIEALYDHVEPGGYLIFNYPNEATREWLRGQPEQKREFFALVDSGTNLITRTEIERLLGTEASDYWSFVGAADQRSGDSPAVFVRR